MPTQFQEFQVSEHTLRYRPWSAFRAVSEWGNFAAEFGDVAIDFLVSPGALDALAEGLEMGKDGAGVVTLQAVIAYLDGEDLGDRCSRYLESCDVEVRAPGGVWLPLHGETAGESVEAAGVDAWTILEASWHVVSEGLRPLFVRLVSLAAAKGKASQKHSTAPEGAA